MKPDYKNLIATNIDNNKDNTNGKANARSKEHR